MHPHVYIVSLHALNGSNKRIVKNPKKMHLIIVQDANNVITLDGWMVMQVDMFITCQSKGSQCNSRLKLIPFASYTMLDFSFSLCIVMNMVIIIIIIIAKIKWLMRLSCACAQASLSLWCCAAPSFSLMPHSLFNRHSKGLFCVVFFNTKKMRSERMNNKKRTGIGCEQ